MQDTMKQMLERDGLLEECLQRGSDINIKSVAMKKKTVTLNRQMGRRLWCYRIVGGTLAIVVVAALIYWVISWFKA
jgi:hypothetical protein